MKFSITITLASLLNAMLIGAVILALGTLVLLVSFMFPMESAISVGLFTWGVIGQGAGAIIAGTGYALVQKGWFAEKTE